MAIEEAVYAWKNGELVPLRKVAENASSDSLHLNLCAFEGIRCYQNEKTGKSYVFRLRDHMERFLQNCREDSIDMPYSVDELCEAVVELIRANGFLSCYIRPFVYNSYGLAGINPKGFAIDVIIACWHRDMPLEINAFEADKAINLLTWHEQSDISTPEYIRSDIVYPNSALAKIDYFEHGYDGVISISEDGIIREEVGETLFIIRDDTLYTSPLPEGVSGSIIRETIMRIAADMKISVSEKELCRVDLLVADEAFVIGPVVEIASIGSVDGCVIGGGESEGVGRAILARFGEIARGKRARYKKWLTEIQTSTQG